MPEISGRAGWAALLDEMERRAGHASSGLQPLEPWTPPGADDLLPKELAERAAGVLAAQARAIAGLRAEEEELRSQLQAMGPAAQPSSSEFPVYLDTIG